MDRIPFFENGFMIMRESADLQVPIGCIHFEYYQSIDDLRSKLKRDEFEIQQVITNADFISTGVKPGNAFQYSLIDFEDHKDTLSFLTTLVK